MNRLHQILIGTLAVQLVLAVIVFWPRVFTSEANSGSLLAEFKADEVVELMLSDGDGNRVFLTKNDGKWVLPANGAYPADDSKITPLLGKIEGIQTNRLVTQTRGSHKRLKVAGDDFSRQIELKLQDGKEFKLFLGSSGGAGATHVRVDGQDEVFLAADISAFDANAQLSSWIDTTYYTIPEDTVVAITLENANGTFEFEKLGEAWVMKGLAEGETLKENNVQSLVTQVTTLRMTSPIGKEEDPAWGLDTPAATVTLKTSGEAGEKTYTLRIGAQSGENEDHVASWSDSEYYVWVSKFTTDNFTQKTREEYAEVPAEAEPQEEETGTASESE